MRGGGFGIGSFFGIKVNIDWSWIFIFLLVVWNLAGSLLARTTPGWSLPTIWGTAIVAALVFFASVLAHELAHSLVAQAQGIPVRNITLFIFGGVSSIQRDPPSPRAEFLITIVGPLTSIVIGIIFLFLGSISTVGNQNIVIDPAGLMRERSPLSIILTWLGQVNLALGIFNMIPGFPLDGGRVLRSILWAITDNLRKATRWASIVGRVIGWAIIVVGAFSFFVWGGLLQGIWLVFIGWFLQSAASQSYQQLVVQDILEDVPVSRLMRQDPPTTSPDVSVSGLVHDHVMGTDDHAFPVMQSDRLVGIVCLHDIRRVDRNDWDSTRVEDIMTPADKVVTISPEDEASDALNQLSEKDVNQLPVIKDGALVGLLRRRDVIQWLQLHSNQAKG